MRFILLLVFSIRYTNTENVTEKPQNNENSTKFKCDNEVLNSMKLQIENLVTMQAIQRLRMDPLYSERDKILFNTFLNDAKIMLNKMNDVCGMFEMLESFQENTVIDTFKQIKQEFLNNLIAIFDLQRKTIEEHDEHLFKIQKLQLEVFESRTPDEENSIKRATLITRLEHLKKQFAMDNTLSTNRNNLLNQFKIIQDHLQSNLCYILELLRIFPTDEHENSRGNDILMAAEIIPALNTKPLDTHSSNLPAMPTDVANLMQLLHNDSELQTNIIDQKFTDQRAMLLGDLKEFQNNLTEMFRGLPNLNNMQTCNIIYNRNHRPQG